MPTLGFEGNQIKRRKLAAKLIFFSECKGRFVEFGAALVAVNATLDTINTDDVEQFRDKWCDVSDCLRIETDPFERMKYELMLAYLGTILDEMCDLLRVSAEGCFDSDARIDHN